MLAKIFVVAGLVTSVLLSNAHAQQRSAEIDAVMERAAQWVARYEEHELGNLIGTETYAQSIIFLDSRGRKIGGNQLNTKSSFLIAEVGGERFGIRKVEEINGFPEEIKEVNFAELMDDSPEGRDKLIAALREGTRFITPAVSSERSTFQRSP